MIKYIGSKRLLIPQILAAVGAFEGVERVLDLFSGTSRVGYALKGAGYQVVSNDHLSYAATLARCYVEADRDAQHAPAERILAELSTLPGRPGYFTETFCEGARYFQPKNGARVDAIRDRIQELSLEPILEAVVLTSLMEAADRVDSTTGVQMAYLKKWAKRAHSDLELRVPKLLPGGGTALQLEAVQAARSVEVDVAYLDPPYNQHSYMGNYHVWETLVRWDEPEPYGIAQKRIQCKEYKSPFNSKRRIRDAIRETVAALRCRHLVVSFSHEGHITADEMVDILKERGEVRLVEMDFPRYVGAKIGIYNPSGKRVGRVSHTRNKELLFLVSDDQEALDRAARAISEASAPGMR